MKKTREKEREETERELSLLLSATIRLEDELNAIMSD